jgi:hypothetical protein
VSVVPSFEQILEAIRENPGYVPPPGADEYAFWRMSVSIATDPKDPPALGYENVDRIFAAVGNIEHPPELDGDPRFHQLRRWLMLQYLRWSPNWYSQAVEFSSTKLEKRKIERLNQVRTKANALNRLLPDNTDGGPFSAARVNVRSLIEATDRELAWMTDRKLPNLAYQDQFRKCSAIEWFTGTHLPLVFRHVFCRPPKLSRDTSQLFDGPYIRFAEAVLGELEITNGGHPYSRETIARALTNARKGKGRRKRRAGQ